MCGIVGYSGPKNPKDVIISGLKSMEYRGYDSAGVAILHQGDFKRVRAEGKLATLQAKLENEEFDGHLGIGHTRWATHGPPTERNAHPQTVRGVSIVHNGIIENYLELKEKLAGLAKFESDTDSELIAHLVALNLEGKLPESLRASPVAVPSSATLLQRILEIMPHLRGAYSVLVIAKDYPDEMVAFKNGPPLIVGQGAGAVLVASDVQAVLPHTNRVVHLEDNEVVHAHGETFSIYDHTGKELNKKVTEVDWTEEKAEKSGFAHFMLKEIFEQPIAVAKAIAPHVSLENHSIQMNIAGMDVGQWKDIQRIFIIACGTSNYAGMVGKYLFEELARVPVETDIASEFRYRNPILPENSLAITVSQSGETADTLAALRLLKSRGVPVLSICNVKNSTIDREADGHVYMNSGVEIGVASTKAFTSTLAIMNLLALQLAKAKKLLSVSREAELVRALLATPAQMEIVLACDKFFAEAAVTLKKYKGFLYLGRGISFPIALEGALKLKELAYMHAEGYAAGEMKHGPLALIDKQMCVVTLLPSNELYDKTLSNLEEAKARGGQVISIGTHGNDRLKLISEHFLTLPKAEWTVNPILETIPVQLMAYHVAAALGHDVDQPRNLAKSVTVE